MPRAGALHRCFATASPYCDLAGGLARDELNLEPPTVLSTLRLRRVRPETPPGLPSPAYARDFIPRHRSPATPSAIRTTPPMWKVTVSIYLSRNILSRNFCTEQLGSRAGKPFWAATQIRKRRAQPGRGGNSEGLARVGVILESFSTANRNARERRASRNLLSRNNCTIRFPAEVVGKLGIFDSANCAEPVDKLWRSCGGKSATEAAASKTSQTGLQTGGVARPFTVQIPPNLSKRSKNRVRTKILDRAKRRDPGR